MWNKWNYTCLKRRHGYFPPVARMRKTSSYLSKSRSIKEKVKLDGIKKIRLQGENTLSNVKKWRMGKIATFITKVEHA